MTGVKKLRICSPLEKSRRLLSVRSNFFSREYQYFRLDSHGKRSIDIRVRSSMKKPSHFYTDSFQLYIPKKRCGVGHRRRGIFFSRHLVTSRFDRIIPKQLLKVSLRRESFIQRIECGKILQKRVSPYVWRRRFRIY